MNQSSHVKLLNTHDVRESQNADRLVFRGPFSANDDKLNHFNCAEY